MAPNEAYELAGRALELLDTRILSKDFNHGDFEEYGHDDAGNRTRLRKRDGTEIVYQYDPLDRLAAKFVPPSASGAAGYAVFYGYDVGNRQTFARFGSAAARE